MNAEHAHHEKEEHEKKEYTIIVNSSPKKWPKHEITYDEVIHLAFGNPAPNQAFTVSYSNAEGKKKDGNLVEGEKVQVRDGTSFDVDRTTNS